MSGEIIAALVGVFGALAGSALGIWSQAQSNKLAMLQRRIDRYRLEIRARQAEEEIAAEWLSQLGVASSKNSAKLALRERTEIARGLRPSIGPAEIRE